MVGRMEVSDPSRLCGALYVIGFTMSVSKDREKLAVS
jgi:hypothetical protein